MWDGLLNRSLIAGCLICFNFSHYEYLCAYGSLCTLNCFLRIHSKGYKSFKNPGQFCQTAPECLYQFSLWARERGWLLKPPGWPSVAVHILLKLQFSRRPPQHWVPVNLWKLTKAFILAKKCPHACLNQLKKKIMLVKEERNVDSFIFFLSPTSVCVREGGMRVV